MIDLDGIIGGFGGELVDIHVAALRRSSDDHGENAGGQDDERRAGGVTEHGGNALGIDALRRIVAVAEKMELIGETADGATAGIDEGKPQVAAVEPDRRQHAAHAAVGIDDIGGGRMRILIVLGVVSVMQPDRLRCRVDVGVACR